MVERRRAVKNTDRRRVGVRPPRRSGKDTSLRLALPARHRRCARSPAIPGWRRRVQNSPGWRCAMTNAPHCSITGSIIGEDASPSGTKPGTKLFLFSPKTAEYLEFFDNPRAPKVGFELSVSRERGYRPELSSVIYVPENVRFCRTNIPSRPRWRLLSSCTRTPNGRLATGGGRDSLSAALTSRE